ncbi:MAG: sugar transferase [Spirochaetaceae bacterium]
MTRFIDILLSSIAIIILSPLLIPIIIILKLTGEHYIFYAQERMGKNVKTFKVLKFATMLKNSPNMTGASVTKRDDPRVLPFGKFLRKSKINELPQLFNIWLGQMSVVGPRPLTPDQFYNYSEEQQKIISKLTPGLTGIGSLVFRDEESIMEKSGMDYNVIHDTIIAKYKGDLECWYYSNRNITLYIKIIFLTAYAVFKSDFDARSRFKTLPKAEEQLEKLF